ncbi:MAG: hypothetical protein RLZZ480_413 [Candidatus Parcubacteria bacterium]|jgi:hypothetical protein
MGEGLDPKGGEMIFSKNHFATHTPSATICVRKTVRPSTTLYVSFMIHKEWKDA